MLRRQQRQGGDGQGGEGKPAADHGLCGGALTAGWMSSVSEMSQVGSRMCWPGAQKRGLGSEEDSRLFFKAWQG